MLNACHFSLQVSDIGDWQKQNRVCGSDRTELSRRGIHSFLHSVSIFLHEQPDWHVTVNMICDRASPDLQAFCTDITQHYAMPRLWVIHTDLAEPGLQSSMRTCFSWLRDQGATLVGHFQDDRIYQPETIRDCVEMLSQMRSQGSTDAVVTPINDVEYWKTIYHNQSTPRLMVLGRRDYWIQIYDVSCNIMTTHAQLKSNYDLVESFVNLCGQDPAELARMSRPLLENVSLNRMFVQRGILGLCPIRTLSHHLCVAERQDPYENWQDLWDQIPRLTAPKT